MWYFRLFKLKLKKHEKIPRVFSPAVKKKPFNCATAMVLTFLLHDPISAEIRTVDSQSDLTILSQLWLIKIWLHLTKEIEAPVDSFKQITVFCKSKLRVVTLFTGEWERPPIYEKKSSAGPGVFYLLTFLPKLQTFLETLLDLSFPHISTVRHWPCAGMIK